MAYKYSNVSKSMTLTTSIGVSDTTIVVNDATGLPITFPYRLAIGYETAALEIVYVTAATGNNLTVQRGREDTPSQTHSVGAVVVHAATAQDFKDAAEHIDATTNVHGVGASSSVVGTATTQTLTNKTMSGASNTFSNIPGSAINVSPVFHGVIVDNVGVSSSAALSADTQDGNTQPSVLIRARNGADALKFIPGDASVTTGNFIEAQDLSSVSKFKVTRAGVVTQAGDLTVDGTTTTTKHIAATQSAAGTVGVSVAAHASPTAPLVTLGSRSAQPSLRIDRDNSTATGNFIQLRNESAADLINLARDGSIVAFNTVKGSDFTIAGAPDRSVKTELDALLAAWTSWSPTLTNLTLGNGTVTAKRRLIGKTLDYRFKFVLGSTSAVGTLPRFTLPFTPHADYAVNQDLLGQGVLLDAGTVNRSAVVEFVSGSTVEIRDVASTGAFVAITATAPWTWTTSDSLMVAGTIELA